MQNTIVEFGIHDNKYAQKIASYITEEIKLGSI